MTVVAYILTSTPHAYEQWLFLLNKGGKVPTKDRLEFPRAESLEQIQMMDPVPMVYTWGNYFASDKGENLYKKLVKAKIPVKPYPIVERTTSGKQRAASLNF